MAVSYLLITPKVGESYTTPVDVAKFPAGRLRARSLRAT
jgi:hypothetical protein